MAKVVVKSYSIETVFFEEFRRIAKEKSVNMSGFIRNKIKEFVLENGGSLSEKPKEEEIIKQETTEDSCQIS